MWWLLQLDVDKNLTSQCVQGCGLVQVNVEIKTILGGSPRINITDVLKPADEDDEEEDVKPNIGTACSLVEHSYAWYYTVGHKNQGSDTRVLTQKNPHFYFNLILVYTLYATNNAIFYCF